MICKLTDLPEELLGQVRPAYDVYIKVCSNHGLKILAEELEFVIDNPDHGVDWAPYSYKCMRCNNIWDSNYLYTKHEDFGKLPATCSKCNSEYWYKVPRMIREIVAAPRRGKWKETKVYHQVKEAEK